MLRLFVIACFAATGLCGAERSPLVIDGRLPTYPQLAIQARVSGKVRVKFRVVNGVVEDATVVQTDSKLLVASTLQNVRTWRFEPSTNAQIETEFVYEIGRSDAVIPENPTLELRLPGYVRLVATPVQPTVIH
jgi:TonB family protein